MTSIRIDIPVCSRAGKVSLDLVDLIIGQCLGVYGAQGGGESDGREESVHVEVVE